MRRTTIEHPVPREWRAMARKRGPFLAAGVLALLAVAWALLAGGSSDAGEGETAEEHAEQDSVVTLDSAAVRLAGIQLFTAMPASNDTLVANGTITYDANHVATVSSRAEARVLAVRADLGQRVSVGTVLALLESSEVGETRGDLERARANMDVARRNYEREQRLFAQSITSQKDLLEAEGAFRLARADYNSALARLRAVGAGAGAGATFGLASPISGVVVERNAGPGQVVGPSTNLFVVADLRHVWITVDVYEADLPRVRQGAAVVVSPAALEGQTFPGRVTYAGGVVDPASRTFKVRVELDNPGQRLRPGMFAQVRITTPAAVPVAGAPPSVPEIAVQELNGKQVIFVARGATGRFVAREVTLGPRSASGFVAVTSGIKPGEQVVARGAFQLKAEMLKASFGEDH